MARRAKILLIACLIGLISGMCAGYTIYYWPDQEVFVGTALVFILFGLWAWGSSQ